MKTFMKRLNGQKFRYSKVDGQFIIHRLVDDLFVIRR